MHLSIFNNKKNLNLICLQTVCNKRKEGNENCILLSISSFQIFYNLYLERIS